MSEHHYKLAVNMAKKSISRFRLGAVLARKSRVISTGFNDMRRTHPKMQRFNPDKSWCPGLHAEVDACLGVDRKELQGAEIYVARILKSGAIALARPCEICQRFLLDVGVRRIYFTDITGNWREL
jgi:deoxycytidylate deaminase